MEFNVSEFINPERTAIHIVRAVLTSSEYLRAKIVNFTRFSFNMERREDCRLRDLAAYRRIFRPLPFSYLILARGMDATIMLLYVFCYRV